MMFHEYLSPVDLSAAAFSFIPEEEDCLGRHVKMQPEEVTGEDTRIALIGVNETRGAAEFYENVNGADLFRAAFFGLKKHDNPSLIADLGNLKPGKTREDTYFGLATVIEELLGMNILPVIIGGSQDLTFAHYLAYKNRKQVINMASVDSRFDLGRPEDDLNSRSYLGKIILEKPNYLFNFSCIGYQTYYVGQQAVELMNKLYFDTYRLGHIKSDITELEPIIRNAEVLSFDLSAVRYSDSPGSTMASPNGFNGEDACQMMMYAGMSDKMQGVGLYEFNPSRDRDSQTATLMAQMVWYFIEGYANRKRDLPPAPKGTFITYRVSLSGNTRELIFLKSKKSDRWWMEFPMPENKDFLSRQIYIPCSYKDYQAACNDEMPERWWQTLQKIS